MRPADCRKSVEATKPGRDSRRFGLALPLRDAFADHRVVEGEEQAMSIDRRLQDQVLAALARELGVDAAQVGVSAHDGVATLQGIVPTFRQKWLAERAASHVPSVRAVANDLEVARPDLTTDPVIAQAVADAIEQDDAVPAGRVKTTVRHGW